VRYVVEAVVTDTGVGRAAVVVDGERGMSEPGEPAGKLLVERVQATRIRKQDDRGPVSRSGLAR
jgi:hypothetical protein